MGKPERVTALVGIDRGVLGPRRHPRHAICSRCAVNRDGLAPAPRAAIEVLIEVQIDGCEAGEKNIGIGRSSAIGHRAREIEIHDPVGVRVVDVIRPRHWEVVPSVDGSPVEVDVAVGDFRPEVIESRRRRAVHEAGEIAGRVRSGARGVAKTAQNDGTGLRAGQPLGKFADDAGHFVGCREANRPNDDWRFPSRTICIRDHGGDDDLTPVQRSKTTSRL